VMGRAEVGDAQPGLEGVRALRSESDARIRVGGEMIFTQISAKMWLAMRSSSQVRPGKANMV
jgi:hypothetical protein